MINNLTNASQSTAPLTQLLATRRAERGSQIDAATSGSVAPLSTDQIQSQTGFYNNVVDGTTRLQDGSLCGLKDVNLDDLFPSPNQQIQDATRPRDHDNQTSTDVRSRYRQDAQEIQRARAQAEQMAQSLGEGTHTLTDANGQTYTVTVTQGKDGQVTVETKEPNGSTNTVSYDPKDDSKTSVKTTNADGSSSSLTQDGTNIEDSQTDAQGKTTTDKFSIDDQGNPVDNRTGPDGKNQIITANDDGSSDTRNQVTSFDGTPLYDDDHQPPDYHCQAPPPEPWRAWPFTPYPWTHTDDAIKSGCPV